MIIDSLHRFSAAQSITTGSGVASAPGVVSTNLIDLGAERRIGTGRTLYICSLCTVAMTSSGSNDALDVNLYSDADSGWGSATLRQKLFTFPAVSAAGTLLVAAIRPGMLTETYIGLYYVTDGDALTAGTFTSWLTDQDGIDAWVAYADAITIQ